MTPKHTAAPAAQQVAGIVPAGPGALAEWRRLKRRNPVRPFDALQEAAGWEQTGLEAEAIGEHQFAAHCFRRATDILQAARITVTVAPVSHTVASTTPTPIGRGQRVHPPAPLGRRGAA
jgi:hypothetical protein